MQANSTDNAGPKLTYNNFIFITYTYPIDKWDSHEIDQMTNEQLLFCCIKQRAITKLNS